MGLKVTVYTSAALKGLKSLFRLILLPELFVRDMLQAVLHVPLVGTHRGEGHTTLGAVRRRRRLVLSKYTP
jgi:hypothetical protein